MMAETIANRPIPRRALMGIVKTHAQSRLTVTPQRTAESRLTAPTPMILPLMTCVVLTGTLRTSVIKSVIAPAVWAQKPSTGVILVILLPIVFIIFQPPVIVPKAMAEKQAIGTQS